MTTPKVHPVEGDYGVNSVAQTSDGHGFNIVGKHAKPLVHFSYATKEEAERARSTILSVVSKALAITPHN